MFKDPVQEIQRPSIYGWWTAAWRGETDTTGRRNVTHLRKATGTIPARYSASLRNMGIARSKWGRGGLHQPPSSEGCAKLGGQKLVAVTKMEGLPEWHHLGSSAHFSSKQDPQLCPLLKSAVLRAAVSTPYPWLYRFPYPHAPPAETTTRKNSEQQGK